MPLCAAASITATTALTGAWGAQDKPRGNAKAGFNYLKISLDQFGTFGQFKFHLYGSPCNASDHLFEQWMRDTLQQLTIINSFKSKHLYYLARISFMYYSLIPEFWAFKSLSGKNQFFITKKKTVRILMEQQIKESNPDLAQKIIGSI